MLGDFVPFCSVPTRCHPQCVTQDREGQSLGSAVGHNNEPSGEVPAQATEVPRKKHSKAVGKENHSGTGMSVSLTSVPENPFCSFFPEFCDAGMSIMNSEETVSVTSVKKTQIQYLYIYFFKSSLDSIVAAWCFKI